MSARPKKLDKEKKQLITFRFGKDLYDLIKSLEHYNQQIEQILSAYFKISDKNKK